MSQSGAVEPVHADVRLPHPQGSLSSQGCSDIQLVTVLHGMPAAGSRRPFVGGASLPGNTVPFVIPAVGVSHPCALCVGKAVSGSSCMLYLMIVEGFGKGAGKEEPPDLRSAHCPRRSGVEATSFKFFLLSL
ncbi:Hypothetical predicted protein [Marmota monax]|uniref:Uncharacterized protein n=1 Tax=Marmota monax TaxID=9995 RepID=A0A5E4CSU3_MARMO|nr:Hypothetical predicted protein [Marmota monax]